MNNLTVTIPHQLGRAEARRRIEEGVRQLRGRQGAMLSRLDERWEGDTLHFDAAALGQSVSGKVRVEDAQVFIEVALPWVLALLGGALREQLERQGRGLLERR
jgi:putative polyhydroxyalkanoate system protein